MSLCPLLLSCFRPHCIHGVKNCLLQTAEKSFPKLALGHDLLWFGPGGTGTRKEAGLCQSLGLPSDLLCNLSVFPNWGFVSEAGQDSHKMH